MLYSLNASMVAYQVVFQLLATVALLSSVDAQSFPTFDICNKQTYSIKSSDFGEVRHIRNSTTNHLECLSVIKITSTNPVILLNIEEVGTGPRNCTYVHINQRSYCFAEGNSLVLSDSSASGNLTVALQSSSQNLSFKFFTKGMWNTIISKV